MGIVSMAVQSFGDFSLSCITHLLHSLLPFHWMHRKMKGFGTNVKYIVMTVIRQRGELTVHNITFLCCFHETDIGHNSDR